VKRPYSYSGKMGMCPSWQLAAASRGKLGTSRSVPIPRLRFSPALAGASGFHRS
jgi:hypothetical protein